jgi:hypothetical protein
MQPSTAQRKRTALQELPLPKAGFGVRFSHRTVSISTDNGKKCNLNGIVFRLLPYKLLKTLALHEYHSSEYLLPVRATMGNMAPSVCTSIASLVHAIPCTHQSTRLVQQLIGS